MAAPTRRKKSKKKLIAFLVLIVVAAVAVGTLATRKKEKPIEVTVEKAERRTVTSIVSATGRIFPEVEVKISSEVAGEIIDLPVVEGQLVKKGDLLVKIDPERYEAQVRQREVSINTAKSKSLEAKANRLQAEQDLRRVEELFAKGFTSEKEIEDARTLLQIRKVQEESSLLEIERTESTLEEAQDYLSKTILFAPMDGTISKLDSELGERVVGTGSFAGTEIMRVADLTNIEVRIEVSETDIVHVKIGDKATVEVDAITDEKFEGYVTEISSSAANVRQNNDQLTTFEVRIKLVKPSSKLRPGMTATADIETKTVEDAISVPMQSVTVRKKDEVEKALNPDLKDVADKGSKNPPKMGDDESKKPEGEKATKDDLQRIVFIVKEDKVAMRKVKTGIADNTYIVIEEGISPGEEVVSGSYRAITRDLAHDKLVTLKSMDKGKKSDEKKN
jgi:HlyD family secretion protein